MNEIPSAPNNPLSSAIRTKGLLLCRHAEELSLQCIAAVRNGSTELLHDLQVGKHTVITELATILQGRDMAGYPDLLHAVELLREALRTELSTLKNSSDQVGNEILTLNAAHRRLTHARQYDAATQQPRSMGGDQLSACG